MVIQAPQKVSKQHSMEDEVEDDVHGPIVLLEEAVGGAADAGEGSLEPATRLVVKELVGNLEVDRNMSFNLSK